MRKASGRGEGRWEEPTLGAWMVGGDQLVVGREEMEADIGEVVMTEPGRMGGSGREEGRRCGAIWRWWSKGCRVRSVVGMAGKISVE